MFVVRPEEVVPFETGVLVEIVTEEPVEEDTGVPVVETEPDEEDNEAVTVVHDETVTVEVMVVEVQEAVTVTVMVGKTYPCLSSSLFSL